jgi:L-talarate/galactarate dehydratase
MPELDLISVEPQVEAVVIRQLHMPIDPPIRSGIHHISGIDTVFVELRAGGERGLGYAFAFSSHQAAAIRLLAVELAELVKNAPPRGVRAHWQAMWSHINFIGREGPAALAVAAVDTALWDLLARTARLPLYGLLGAADPSTRIYAAGGWLSWPVHAVIEEAQHFKGAGYHGYKMRVGGPDWREDVRRTEAVREAVGDEFALMVDANQAWSVETAMRAGRALESADLTWIEEPVEAEDLAGSSRVADELATPIAVGETVWGVRGFQRVLEESAGDVIQLDLMRCGGVTGFITIMSMVEARRLPVTSHLFTPISAQLMAAAPAAYMVEHLPSWFDPLFEERPLIERGRIRPSQGPGLGLTLAESAIARWEVP